MKFDLIDQLSNRYSTKIFDANKQVPQAKIDILKESLRLSPSSINSQPWHFYIVSDPKVRSEIAAAAWDFNQPKFNDASHVFVFCAKTEFGAEDVRKIEQNVADTRGEALNQQRFEMMSAYAEGMEPGKKSEWLKQQVAMAFGQFMLSCQLLELDCCPIGGFSEEAMDQLLGLKEKGLTSVVVAAVGYRSEEDFNTVDKAAKARLSQQEVITEL
ncbi:nitroreductase family protein [Pelagibaculum spongiae]|uniref:NAD(P)H nitroreductase n=1 Tax=Pelagibaculum spongiae TaxID=2080658 RepID=A0A2V1GX33_9GAMM|nr:nitroreductase family protein [Pelagibaculum spongiae]PVZ70570.1 NAD(P)H nitroreductase [Pelagibaculum spongiae]